jgi:hypothetical protein
MDELPMVLLIRSESHLHGRGATILTALG